MEEETDIIKIVLFSLRNFTNRERLSFHPVSTYFFHVSLVGFISINAMVYLIFPFKSSEHRNMSFEMEFCYGFKLKHLF